MNRIFSLEDRLIFQQIFIHKQCLLGRNAIYHDCHFTNLKTSYVFGPSLVNIQKLRNMHLKIWKYVVQKFGYHIYVQHRFSNNACTWKDVAGVLKICNFVWINQIQSLVTGPQECWQNSFSAEWYLVRSLLLFHEKS